VYAPVPPAGVAVAVPSHTPLQLAFVFAAATVRSGGFVNVTVAELKHPFASVAVMVYDPAHNPETDCVVCPIGAQLYVYGFVPPAAFALATPSHAPKQLREFVELVTTIFTIGLTVHVAVVVHLQRR